MAEKPLLLDQMYQQQQNQTGAQGAGIQPPAQYQPLQNVEVGQYSYNPIQYDAAGKPVYIPPDQANPYFTGNATNKANQQYGSAFSNLYNNINQSYNQYLQGLDSTNFQFDKTIQNAQIQNKHSQNSFANNMLSRGMGQSSLVTTGLGGLSLAGEKGQREINSERNSQLGNLTQNYNTQYQGFQNNLSSLESERQAAIKNYVDQLYQQMYSQGRDQYGDQFNIWKVQQDQAEAQRQRDFQAAQAEKDRAAQQAYARSNSYSSGNSKNNNNSSNTPYSDALATMLESTGNLSEIRLWLDRYGSNLKKEDPGLYTQILGKVSDQRLNPVSAQNPSLIRENALKISPYKKDNRL